MKSIFGALALLALMPVAAGARTICTVVADAGDGRLLLEEGDCRTRVTPASTFKIPLAVMGFDSGFLTDPHAPTLPFQKGYADWGGDDWRQPTDPERWMKYSVVWFSQQVTASLGRKRFEGYVADFQYGNQDVSGDPGKNNGLERSWISSSLRISPVEQVDFLGRMLNGRLPASAESVANTRRILETFDVPGGQHVQGKTGGAYPRNADGSFDRARGWGWFVGWTVADGKTYVFARLDQDEARQEGSPGIRARAAFLKLLPAILDGLPQ